MKNGINEEEIKHVGQAEINNKDYLDFTANNEENEFNLEKQESLITYTSQNKKIDLKGNLKKLEGLEFIELIAPYNKRFRLKFKKFKKFKKRTSARKKFTFIKESKNPKVTAEVKGLSDDKDSSYR